MNFFDYVGKGYTGENTLDRIERIIPIVLTIIIIGLLFMYGKRIKKYDKKIRKIYGISLFFIWLSYFLWYIAHGKFGYQSLPISLCSLTSTGFVVVLLTNHKKMLDIMFYWGIIGGTLAMLFVSDVYRGVESFRYYQFYLDHALILIAPFYYMSVHQYIPSLKSTITSFIMLLIVAIMTLPVNLYYKMDYMIMNPYNPPLDTPAADIANLVNHNLILYVGVLTVLGSIVFMMLYFIIKKLLNLSEKFTIKTS